MIPINAQESSSVSKLKVIVLNSKAIKAIIKKKNPQTMNAWEGVERKVPSYSAGENVKWYNHYGEQYKSSLKN